MDEEDLADAEKARQVSTKESFSGLGSTEEDVARRATVMDLLRPSGETVGLKLLRKMGWRDGQGIGPKVKRHARLDDGDTQESVQDEVHLFAPKNSPMVTFTRKEDFKGLGYRGEAKLKSDALTKTSNGIAEDDSDRDDGFWATSSKPKKKPATRKGGFGVGVLNDHSSDEDPYSMGPKISYNKTLRSDKKRKQRVESNPSTSNANPLLRNKPVFISKKLGTSKAGFRRCRDGRLPLDGFVLASEMLDLTQVTKHPPPSIPEGWKSSKMPSDSQADDRTYQSTADLARASNLDPSKRAAMLGEASLPGKSVFDFLKPDARNRIIGLTKNESLPAAGSETGTAPAVDIESSMPALDPQIAATALGRGVAGFVPYADNPAKLARYRGFLSYRAKVAFEPPKQPPSMRQDEWIKELHEFAHAATIFKPMTGVMASRFTSSASSKSTQPESSAESTREPELLSRPKAKPADPAEEAAQMGMFGPLTRSSTYFYPSRLLCKRFNVPVPTQVTAENEGAPGRFMHHQPTDSASRPSDNPLPNFGSRFQSSGFQTGSGKIVELLGKETMDALRKEAGVKQVMEERNEGPPVVVDPERNEALEAERPGDAVFKAIFGSDSEDD